MEICLADNLRILRHKKGYTLEAVAEIIDVSRQTVAKWEAGDSYPDIFNCLKLASLYMVALDELVTRPLREVTSSDFIAEDDKICGVLDISAEGDINIPQPVMDMFNLHPRDKVLLLADKKQGIALVKCSQFIREERKNEDTEN